MVTKKNIIRITKFILMAIGLVVMSKAFKVGDEVTYYENGSNLFDRSVAYFCCTVTGLSLWEYWRDSLLRLIYLTAFLGCINFALDEFLFNPFVYDLNEKISEWIIISALIVNLTILIFDVFRPTKR